MTISVKPSFGNLTPDTWAFSDSLSPVSEVHVELKPKSLQSTQKDREPGVRNEEIQLSELKEEKVSIDILEAAVNRLNEFVTASERNINFSIDKETGKTVVKLTDKDNNVLRQIPSEEVLRLLKNLEMNKGMIIEDHA